MLKKLCKYDLIWINKLMIIYFIISIIISLLARIMGYFNSSSIGNILYLILRGTSISSFATVIINSVIRIWVRFRNSLYKDESYLTHTLPITKNTLYDSKFLSALLSVFISIIVIIISFAIAFLNKDMINIIKIIFNNNTFIIISSILTILLEVIYMTTSGILGIVIGYKSSNHKVLKSVFIGITLYFIMQLLILGIVYIVGLFNTPIGSLFNNNYNVLDDSYKSLIIIVNIIYVVFISIMYFIGKKLFNKGVNVE